MYIMGLAQQTNSFLLCVGFGFLLDILYIAVRFIRKIFFVSHKAVLVQDISYFVAATLGVFFFLLYANNGEVRGYVFLALLLGGIICHCSLGQFILKLSDHIALFLRKILTRLLDPFRMIMVKVAQILKKLRKKLAKLIKKDKNKENSSCNDGV